MLLQLAFSIQFNVLATYILWGVLKKCENFSEEFEHFFDEILNFQPPGRKYKGSFLLNLEKSSRNSIYFGCRTNLKNTLYFVRHPPVAWSIKHYTIY